MVEFEVSELLGLFKGILPSCWAARSSERKLQAILRAGDGEFLRFRAEVQAGESYFSKSKMRDCVRIRCEAGKSHGSSQPMAEIFHF
jgi:hypothetical protein